MGCYCNLGFGVIFVGWSSEDRSKGGNNTVLYVSTFKR